jgi:hypothetical protein
MILAVAPREQTRSPRFHERSSRPGSFGRGPSNGTPRTPRLRRPQHDDLDQNPGCTGIEEAVEQLVHMNLASLRGYQEVADVTTNPHIRDFAQVMLSQRSAQCRELMEGWSGLLVAPDQDDPAANDLSLLWVRALWNLDQDESGNSLEMIAEAEQLLEEAYLKAAALYEPCPIATLFRQHATSICGALQRLEVGLELGAADGIRE